MKSTSMGSTFSTPKCELIIDLGHARGRPGSALGQAAFPPGLHPAPEGDPAAADLDADM